MRRERPVFGGCPRQHRPLSLSLSLVPAQFLLQNGDGNLVGTAVGGKPFPSPFLLSEAFSLRATIPGSRAWPQDLSRPCEVLGKGGPGRHLGEGREERGEGRQDLLPLVLFHHIRSLLSQIVLLSACFGHFCVWIERLWSSTMKGGRTCGSSDIL